MVWNLIDRNRLEPNVRLALTNFFGKNIEYIYFYTQSYRKGREPIAKIDFLLYLGIIQEHVVQYVLTPFTSPQGVYHVHAIVRLRTARSRVALKTMMYQQYGYADIQPVKSLHESWVNRKKATCSFEKIASYIWLNDANDKCGPHSIYIEPPPACKNCEKCNHLISMENSQKKIKTLGNFFSEHVYTKCHVTMGPDLLGVKRLLVAPLCPDSLGELDDSLIMAVLSL